MNSVLDPQWHTASPTEWIARLADFFQGHKGEKLQRMYSVTVRSYREVTGQVTANSFMSDDAPAFFNVWKDVMREPKHRLLCAWHINKNWREHIPFSGGVHDCVRKF